MKSEARVLIIDDDPFARHWMALILARDWRTRILGEISHLDQIPNFYAERKLKSTQPNVILLDADLVASERNSKQIWEQLACLPGAPLVLLIGREANPALAQTTPFLHFCGYILKAEINYALAWAIAFASEQTWVITPGLHSFYVRPDQTHPVIEMDGRKPVHKLTNGEAEAARMALIFSMERKEISDEFKITTEWVYELVSEIYNKLGMEEILNGEVDPADYLGQHFTQVPRFREVLKSISGPKKKKKDLETLAFHILTMPNIEAF